MKKCSYKRLTSSKKNSRVESNLASIESNNLKKTIGPDKNIIDLGNENVESSMNLAKSEDSTAKNSNKSAFRGQTDAKQVSKANADNRNLPATGE